MVLLRSEEFFPPLLCAIVLCEIPWRSPFRFVSPKYRFRRISSPNSKREYLSARPNIFILPHSAVAENWLTYRNCRQVKILSADTPDNLYNLTDDHPFLAYCSLYWGPMLKKNSRTEPCYFPCSCLPNVMATYRQHRLLSKSGLILRVFIQAPSRVDCYYEI